MDGSSPHQPPRTAISPNPVTSSPWTETAWFAAALLGLHATTFYSYLLFHSFAELFSVFVAVSIFIITINSWQSLGSPTLRIVGVGYLFVGMLDVLHTLSFDGMGVFSGYNYYSPQFWIAARAVESLTLLAGFAFLGTDVRIRRGVLFSGYAAVTAAFVLAILVFRWFPVCFVPGHGLTAFKIDSEYAICAILAVSLVLLYRRRRLFDPRVLRFLAGSIALTIASELCFTRYHANAMNDAFNEAGHLFKIGAFYLLYKAFVVTGLRDPINLLLRDLRQTEARAARAKELAREREHFAALLQTAGDGVHVFDSDGNVLEVNEKFCSMLGYARTEMLGMNVAQWDARFSPEEIRAKILDLLRHDTVFETRHRRKDGSIFDVEISARAIDFDGRTVIWNASRDVTERKRTERRLQLGANVFTHAREGIMITDAAANIIAVNRAFSTITGYAAEEVIGRNPRMLQSGRQGPDFYRAMWQGVLEHKHWSGEVWNRRKGGEVYAEALTISAVLDESGHVQHYVGMMIDITLIKEHERQLERMAHYDALTGLPNRVLLTDRLRQAIAHAQRHDNLVAVAVLDLDGFKAVNDRYGHAVGDEFLIAVAHGMNMVLREGDTLSRIGGDEFVAVLADLDRVVDCEPVLLRLLAAASRQITVDGRLLQSSASIGVTIYPSDGESDPDHLLRRADQAMYSAKQGGKSRYHFFDAAQDNVIRAQRQWVDRIEAGIERDEFVLHYQPKVNLRTGAVVGAEALVRWRHPERGLLPPSEFLPPIEGHQVGIRMGEWVLGSALRQIGDWLARGLRVPVSVNLDAPQLLQPDFLARLAAQLANHADVDPDLLELEILETSALENLSAGKTGALEGIARVSEVMHACVEVGVRFSLDDFGTGYSSLTYLKHLPVEVIKIDQSFVRDMLEDAGDRALVEGVIGLAKAFHRTIIAEGVETAEQGQALLGFGCELAQGYGIARPMPAERLPEWMAEWAAEWTTRWKPFVAPEGVGAAPG